MNEFQDEMKHMMSTIALLAEMQQQLTCIREQADRLDDLAENRDTFLELLRKNDEVLAQLDTVLCYPTIN